MEFMKIGDSAIKISLGAKEAAEYNITEGMVSSENEIKRSFSRILERAKRELGIKAQAGQVLAEVFSSRDGGFEIFVSYIKSENETQGGKNAQKNVFLVQSTDSLIHLKKMLDNQEADYEIYMNDSTKKYYIVLQSQRKSDIALGIVCEHAIPLRQSSARYIQKYATRVSP